MIQVIKKLDTSLLDFPPVIEYLRQFEKWEIVNEDIKEDNGEVNILSENELMQIVELMLNDTRKALSDKNITMNITDDAKKFLLRKGTDIKYGARPLRRAIQRYLEDELSDMILKSELQNGMTVNVDYSEDKLQFSV